MSVKKQRRLLPRCAGTTADGSQCGRRCADPDQQPPLCHIHLAKAQGMSHSPLTEPVTDVDEIAILKRLARSSNEQIKLRAVDLLIDIRRKDKEREQAKQPTSDTGAFLNALTPDEREAVRSLVAQLREIQRAVYARRSDLPRPGWLVAEEGVVAPTIARGEAVDEAPSTEDTLPPAQETKADSADDEGWEEI